MVAWVRRWEEIDWLRRRGGMEEWGGKFRAWEAEQEWRACESRARLRRLAGEKEPERARQVLAWGRDGSGGFWDI